jgi:hypothetical protein
LMRRVSTEHKENRFVVLMGRVFSKVITDITSSYSWFHDMQQHSITLRPCPL